MALPELPVPHSPATRRKWAEVINEALEDLDERVQGAGSGGLIPDPDHPGFFKSVEA